MFGFQQNQTSTLFNTNKGANYDDNLGFGFSKKANLNGIVSDGLVCLVDASKQDFIQKNNNILLDLINTSSVTLNNGAYVQDYYSGSVILDGIDDNIIISNSSRYGDNLGTWSIWFYYSISTIDKMTLINRHSTLSRSGINIFVYSSDDSIAVQIYPSTGSAVLGISSTSNALIKNQYNNVSITFNNNKTFRLYINGILISSSIPTNTWSFNNQNIVLGTSVDPFWNKFNGKIANVQIYNRELSANEIMQNYNALLKRFSKINEYFINLDADAKAFLLITGITNQIQTSAINTLVLSLKSNNLWDKMKAIYPFVGGTSTTHKFNLKDPRDLNGAFRLTFVGGWTHSSTGALPSSGYASTYFSPSLNGLTVNSTSVSYYSRTNINGLADFGPSNWYSPYLYGYIKYLDKTYSRINSYDTDVGLSISSSLGLFTFNRNSSSQIALVRNGTSNYINQNSNGISNYQLLLGALAYNQAGTAYDYGNKECAFASIGLGLSDTEATTFYNIVQEYQTILGRQV